MQATNLHTVRHTLLSRIKRYWNHWRPMFLFAGAFLVSAAVGAMAIWWPLKWGCCSDQNRAVGVGLIQVWVTGVGLFLAITGGAMTFRQFFAKPRIIAGLNVNRATVFERPPNIRVGIVLINAGEAPAQQYIAEVGVYRFDLSQSLESLQEHSEIELFELLSEEWRMLAENRLEFEMNEGRHSENWRTDRDTFHNFRSHENANLSPGGVVDIGEVLLNLEPGYQYIVHVVTAAVKDDKIYEWFLTAGELGIFECKLKSESKSLLGRQA